MENDPPDLYATRNQTLQSRLDLNRSISQEASRETEAVVFISTDVQVRTIIESVEDSITDAASESARQLIIWNG
jgi:hypothetical protein